LSCIGKDVFENCWTLQSIYIPSSLQAVLAKYQSRLKIMPPRESSAGSTKTGRTE
jgi:hypothetical protein